MDTKTKKHGMMTLSGILVVGVLLISGCIGGREAKPEEKLGIDKELDIQNVKIIFLHHSTGEEIWRGGVPQWFGKYNINNGVNYSIVEQEFPKESPYGWNNYPYDYWNIWVNHTGNREFKEEPTLEILTREYDVIIWKHCFPVSYIEEDTGNANINSDDKRIENYKLQYNALKTKMNKFPDDKFIVWTGAVLVESETDEEPARRAKAFFDWVRNDWDKPGDNIYIWDFYELETKSDIYFKDEYAAGQHNSHPNNAFSQRVAPFFCQRIVDVIEGRGDNSSITGEKSNSGKDFYIGGSELSEEPPDVETYSTELIQPGDLTYLGAFRLPGSSGGSNWEYSGYAMTYYPDGDLNGPDDGFPGSLFAVGHDHHQQLSEISIPTPVISDNLENLNTAITLQEFADIKGGMYGYLEIPRAGLEYLPPQDSQKRGKIYFAWGQHFESEQTPTHGWCELHLSNPQTAGRWHIDGYTNYAVNDYIFEIPEEWTDANIPGKRLATGRFRDGLWSGRGPGLFAYGPWNKGNPPADGTILETTPLLLYGVQEEGAIEITSTEEMQMNNFKEPDEWSGGAWLTAGNKSAVIFVGTKAVGNAWYGFSNGVVYPISGDPDEEYPETPPWPHDDRGWWSEDVEAQIIFYDPNDLASVAKGEIETYEPQPYAILIIDEYLFDTGFDYKRGKRYLVGAAAFDRENRHLYLIERMSDENEKSIIHVWEVGE